MGTAIVILLFVGFALYVFSFSLKFVEAPANEKETYVAILKILGRPIYSLNPFGPGQLWAPLSPFVVDYALVPQHDINDETIIDVRTTRGDLVKIPIGWSFSVDVSTKDSRKRYVQNGGVEGIKKQLKEIIVDRTRELISSQDEGPETWREVQSIDESLIAVLFRKIVDDIDRLPTTLPTSVLLKYWHLPTKQPTEIEAKIWGENWEVLEDKLDKLSPEERENLHLLVEERRKEVRAVRDGCGTRKSNALAIVLQRINLGQIAPQGGIAEAANKIAQEAEERVSERIQQKHFNELAKETAEELVVPIGVAADRVEIQQGKAKKTVTDARVGISSDLLQELPGLAKAFGEGLASLLASSKEKKKGE